MLREALGKLATHSAVYGIADMLARVAAFALMPVHTDPEYLDAAQYGTWDLLGTSIAILTHLAGINMYNAMTRYYFERDEGRDRNAVVSTTVLTVTTIGLAVASLLYLFSDWVVPLFRSAQPGFPHLFHLTLGIFVFQMLKETFFKYLQAEERSVLYGSIALTKLLVEIGLQLYFLMVLGLGVESIFLAMLIGEGLTCALLAVFILPGIGLRFSWPLFLTLGVYTLPLIPNGLLQWVLHSADRWMLQWMEGADAVGTYGAAYKLGQIPFFAIVGPFLLIWYPFVFSLGNLDKQRLLVGKVMPYFMVVLSAGVLAVALAARDLAPFMARDDSYAGVGAGIPWICLGYWFWGLFQMLQTGFYVRKRTKILPLLTGFAALVNIAANLLLIPRLGYLGAAAATTVTFAALCVICHRAVAGVFEVDWPWKRAFVPAGLGLAVFALSLTLSFESTAVSLAARAGLWLAWAGAMWFGGFLDGGERTAVLDMLRNLRTKPAAPDGGNS